MTTETILTNDQIEDIILGVAWPNAEIMEFAELVSRAIEQAVLQSPEVQALRKDAERYRWLRDPCSGAEHAIFYSRGDYGKGLMSGAMLDAAIDAAMEQQHD